MSESPTILTVATNGRIVIPASMRAQIGLRRGEKIVARVEDGAVILEPVDAAIRRAQALVAQYVPKNVDLVQELIDERRQAAMDE